MKRMFDTIMVLFAMLLCVTVLIGCAGVTRVPAGVVYTDVVYTDVKPVNATNYAPGDKMMLKGEATATSYLGWFATGDASIKTAAESAGITKIHHVDYRSKRILGIVASYTVIVYGE